MGTGLGALGFLDSLVGGVASIPLSFMDYFNERDAVAEQNQHQRTAINDARQAGNLYGDTAENRGYAQRHEMLGGFGADGSWQPGHIEQSRNADYDRLNQFANDFWSRGGYQQGAQNATADQRALIGPDGVLGQAGAAAQQGLQRLPGEVNAMEGDRQVYRDHLAAIPTFDKHQAKMEEIYDIEGQRAQNDKIYADLMQARGQSEIATALAVPAKQVADLNSQISRLKAQGRTSASDPQLAQLEAQKADLQGQMADAAGQVTRQKTEQWAKTSTELSANMTNLKASLGTAINQGMAAIGSTVGQLADAIGGSYRDQAAFTSSAINDAVSAGAAIGDVMGDISATMYDAFTRDETMRYDLSVRVPSMIDAQAFDRTASATSQFYATMQGADAIRSAFESSAIDMRYSFSTNVASAMDNLGQLQGMIQNSGNFNMAQQQLDLAQQNSRQNYELGLGGVLTQAFQPRVGLNFGQNGQVTGSSFGIGPVSGSSGR